MNRLVILGAGGHGKVIADIARKLGYRDIVFLDDNAVGSCMEYAIWGTTQLSESLDDGHTDFIIAVGSNGIRKRIAEKYPGLNYVSLVHPAAIVGANVTIGKGTVVTAGAILNPCTTIGAHCIVNSGAVIEHDNILENYVHISPNAALGGTVHIGEGTHIGIGASVRNNVTICCGCTIGVGTAVVKNITQAGVYVGVPARKREC